MVNGSVRLVAQNAPRLLTAKVGGKLQKLLVSNEQLVEKDQPLAWLQSTGNYHEIRTLQQWTAGALPAAAAQNFDQLKQSPLPYLADLGELQTAYQEFQIVLQESIQLLTGGYYQRKKAALQQDAAYLNSLQQQTLKQQELVMQDYELQQTEYRAKETLAQEKVIAPLELNTEKSKLLAKKQSIEQVRSQVVNNSLATHGKEKELMDLDKQVIDQRQRYQSALYTLKSKIEDWLQQYVITAPEKGKVLFATTLQENQMLQVGQELFYVEPIQTTYYAEMMTAQKGLGKIKDGQTVIIKADSYPSEEFGYLKGQVLHIAAIATRTDSFLIKVELPQGLQTNYGKTLYFRNNLYATGEIHTDNRRLLHRLLAKLWTAGQR